ncbi:MAG: recombinase family protein [Candidatus Sabulitectum sp.]|nr:recombinase family protein [Candidatus Sabulitectum sp.]
MRSKKDLACIYARVSTEEQEKEGFSIPAQLKMLREYANKQGFTIAKEFVESETARSTGRTGFNAMLAYLKKNKECRSLLVEKTDRLTRNFEDYIALGITHTNREVHLVKEGKVLSRNSSPSDFFMQNIQVSMAAYTSHNISAEAKKGMRAKAEAGFYPSVAPLGYLNTTNSHGIKVITLDPVLAPLVKQIFELYSKGSVSLKTIAKEMYSLGLRSHKGNKVGISTIYKMLLNPIYRGKFLWNKVEYNGNHEPIVSSALWFAVQDVREDRSVAKPKQSHEFAYIGLMKCGHCDCAITAERKKNKYSYYHCTGYKGKHGEPHVREEKLYEQFSNLLEGLAIDDEVAEFILNGIQKDTADSRKALEDTRERLVSQRKRLLRRSDVLYDDRLDGRIDVTRYDSKSAVIKREIELIDENLSSLESSSNYDPLATAKGIIELAQHAGTMFLKASASDRKQFLRSVLSNCTLREGKIKHQFNEPYALLHDTNTRWKAYRAVSDDLSAMDSFWHPERNSNSGIG